MFGLKKKMFGGDARTFRHDTGGSLGAYRSAKSSGLAAGLVAGTMVATATGWRPVEAIAKGDLVLTFDRGLQPVQSVSHGVQWDSDDPCPEQLWPLDVPAGALGNQEKMTLLPEQCVMVESDFAESTLGDPFALMTASDLEGFRSIQRVQPTQEIPVCQLSFERDEVVFANSGALSFCPCQRVIKLDELLERGSEPGHYMPLCSAEAGRLINGMVKEDLGNTEGRPATARTVKYATVA